MRAYIFTAKERKAVKAFLDGKIPITDHFLSQVRTRMKQFTVLTDDMELYVEFRKAVATDST